MGKGACAATESKAPSIDRDTPYSWADVRKHSTPEDNWIVLEGKIYDVTNFKKRHPGGSQLMDDHAGQDATNPFSLYHMDMQMVRKFMKPLQKGVLSEPTHTTERAQAIEADYQELWKTAKKLNLFKPSIVFHVLYIVQILAFETIAYQIVSHFGVGWVPFLIASLFLGACWTHAGYGMHDYGHRAIFHNSKIDHAVELFIMSFTAGFSASFWNEYHSRHHSKTNKYGKDPTIGINDHLFVIGDGMAKEKAEDNIKTGSASVPFQQQHNYWYLFGPPLYIPVRFQMASVIFAFRRRKNADLIIMALFLMKNMYLYLPHMSIFSFVLYLWIARQVMSHWFVWVSLSNHMPLPQEVEPIEGYTWVELQCAGTCNLPDTYFCDWYTGWLNWQIEHHLFPHMPRENYRTLMPYVKALCKKHDIPYEVKPTIYKAFYDVYDMLRKSGRTWYKEYYSALSGE